MAAERSIAAVVAYGLQPVGFGTAQVLSLYAVNADTLGTVDMARALAAAAGAALLAWGVLIPFCGARRAGMIASLAAILFWSSSSLGIRLSDWFGPESWLVVFGLVGLWCVAMPLAAIVLSRALAEFRPLGLMLGAAAIVSVAVPLGSIAVSALRWDARELLPESGPAEPGATPPGRRPDIYFIILDGMARDDVLARRFGIKRGLGEQLRARGFYLAKKSRANYRTTLYSLASVLNHDYLQNIRTRVPGFMASASFSSA